MQAECFIMRFLREKQISNHYYFYRLDFKHMKDICDVLDLEKKGKKDDLLTRIMDFLMDPKDSGKPVPAVPPPRPKRSSAVKANNRGYAGLDSDDDEEGGRRGRATGRRAKARPSYKDESSSEEDKRGKRSGRKNSDSEAESEPELTPSESDSDVSQLCRARHSVFTFSLAINGEIVLFSYFWWKIEQ